MKKAFVSLLTALSLAFAFVFVACNSGDGGEATPETPSLPTSSLTYEKNGGEYTVTGLTGDDKNIVIPAEYEGLPVTAIRESAFAYSRHNQEILTVTIPDSVTVIERNAFYNRAEMTAVSIGRNSNLETIGNNAFSGNHSLTAFYVPSTVGDIGDGAFNNDGKINFTVEQTNTVYRSENGHLIESATNTLIRGGQNSVIPQSVTAIAQAAFRRSALTELTVPATVTAIGNYFIADSSIATVRFSGTEEQWNSVDKGGMWNYGNGDAEVKFSDGSPNVLIAYFSWSGTTTRLAQHVKEQLPDAATYQIERETPYSDNYNEVAYGEAKEEADSNARPPVKNLISAEVMSGYDAIILMYPIWWHTAPMVVGTFLEAYDLSGVDIYPITQSASMNTAQFNQSFEFVEACATINGRTPNVHAGLGTKSNSAIDAYLAANGLGV